MRTSMRRDGFGIAKVLFLSSLALVLLLPAIAIAQEVPVPEPTALDRLSTELLNILIPAFVLLVGGLFTILLHKFSKKTGIELSSKQIDAWSGLARQAALRAAEWARKEAKTRTEGKKIPGPAVLETGANWAIGMGQKAKLPELGRAYLEGLVEAELFKLRQEEAATVPDEIRLKDYVPKI